MKALDDAHATDGGNVESSKMIGVDVAPLEKLNRPVTLAQLKNENKFQDFLLLEIYSLSVMRVSEMHWDMVMAKSK